MCKKTNSGAAIKIVTLLVVFCLFFEYAAGACLSYGASCLGAHGKRSENRNSPLTRTPQNTRIFLSKLLNGDYQFLSEPQMDGDDLKNLQNIMNGVDENYSLDDVYPRVRGQRLPKFEKRSAKFN